MNENTMEFVYDTFTIMIFVAAMSLFIWINASTNRNLELFDTVYSNHREVYEHANDDVDYYMTGAEIIFQIHNGLETEIVIDGTDVLVDVDINTFNYSIIDPNARYDIKKVIDGSGNITRIEYTKR